MAHKGADVGRGLSGEGRVWDEDFAPEAFADFDFPRRRITGGKGRPSNGSDRITNGNGRSTNGNGASVNGNGRSADGNGRSANGYRRITNGNGYHDLTADDSLLSSPRQHVASGEPSQGVPGRRTVTIRGYGGERNLPWTAGQSRRRPAQPRHQRPGFRADRAAMWAVLLGIMLVVVAAASSHAAMLRAPGVRTQARGPAHAATVTARRSVAAASPHRTRGF
jgi:hypothetical protein